MEIGSWNGLGERTEEREDGRDRAEIRRSTSRDLDLVKWGFSSCEGGLGSYVCKFINGRAEMLVSSPLGLIEPFQALCWISPSFFFFFFSGLDYLFVLVYFFCDEICEILVLRWIWIRRNILLNWSFVLGKECLFIHLFIFWILTLRLI